MAGAAGADQASREAKELASLSLEDLLGLEIEAASKTAERMHSVPASIYVITAEDIRRSGATRLQDVFQMVPGAWITDHSYDFSEFTIRERTAEYAASVQVLIDGVPMQNQVHGGFMFPLFDLDLADIERIEVIKGSAGTIYGANAATGVVSITTWSGSEAGSTELQMQAGTNEYFAPSVRFDHALADHARIVGSVKYKSHAGYRHNPSFDGDEVLAYSPILSKNVVVENRFAEQHANQEIGSGRVRYEHELSEDSRWSSQLFMTGGSGERYSLWKRDYPDEPGPIPGDSVMVGRNETELIALSSRLDHRFSTDHSAFAHAWITKDNRRAAEAGGYTYEVRSFELEAQDNRSLGAHDLIVGANVRSVQFRIGGYSDRSQAFFREAEFGEVLYAAFAQDRISVTNALDLTLGAKIETWTLVGSDPHLLPSARISFTPSSTFTLWGSAARTITTPGYAQTGIEFLIEPVPPAWVWLSQGTPADQVPAGAGHWIALTAGDDVDPTEYNTAEVGVRVAPSRAVMFDTNFYFTRCTNRITANIEDLDLDTVLPSETPSGEPFVPIFYVSQEEGELYGGETVVRAEAGPMIRLELSHAWFRSHFYAMDGFDRHRANNANPPWTPEHVLRSRLYFDPTPQWAFTVNAVWGSKHTSVDAYDYVAQKSASVEEGGIVPEPSKTRVALDASVERSFLGDALRVGVWGRNILADDPYVAAYSEFAFLAHPHTIHRTFGVSVSFRP